MTRDVAEQKRRDIAPFWAMIAIFAAPVIAAWFFYLNPQYLPSGRTNKGVLIEPVVPLPANLELSTPEGTALDRSRFAGKWTLVYLTGDRCGDHCQDRLIAIRQIRLALGESQLNVERLLVMTDPGAADVAERMRETFAGMEVALTDGAEAAPLLNRLGDPSAALGRVYILDPMGNLMMRYPPDAPAEDTLKDMERLLKASKNWIKGAQYGHK